MRMLWETMVEALLKPRKEISTVLLIPAEQGTYLISRAGWLVRHTLHLENPCWLSIVTLLSFVSWT